ncbi:MAG: hypothetical protein ACLQHS_11150 [Candidatus Limnocylindrales bacterium]
MHDTPVVPEHVPLTTLLSWAWIAHTIEVDNAFEAASSETVGRHFRISLAMWTSGLRSIPAEGISVGELRERTRAACNIAGLERWGWISIGEINGMRRAGYGTGRGIRADTVLRPTRAGLYAQKLWPRTISAVEERWRSRFGGEVIDALHETLIAMARPMPWSPPEVAPSDGFWTHVIDGDGADDDGRPLVALLGQVLTAMTLDHERGAKVSLPLAANVLRVIGSGAIRLRDVSALSGLSNEGIAMAAGYLLRRSLATSAPERAMRLTPEGRDALADCEDRARQQDAGALRQALDALLQQTTALSAGLVPPEGCWRAQTPYVAQSRRLVANPLGSLPWHPMVLHRGGWPDAS